MAFVAPGMPTAGLPYGPAGTFGDPARPQGPFEPRTIWSHPTSREADVAKSQMLFLGTTRSPSNLAELRALRLAAAACDPLANRRLVLNFAVDPWLARWTRFAAFRSMDLNFHMYIKTRRPMRLAQCFIGHAPTTPRALRSPLLFLRGGPDGEGIREIRVSELRAGDDRPLPSMPRPVRDIPLSLVRIRGALRDAMGSVAVTLKIMPDGLEVDLEALKGSVREALRSAFRSMKEEPVAFGLKAILAIAVVDDATGGSERLEEALAAIPGVSSVETVDVTLV